MWTLAYVAGVFLFVGVFAYAEWRWEAESWAQRFAAPSAEVRARAMSDYSLRVSRLPHPVPCHSLVLGLSDVPEVRREAMIAVVRVVRSGYCVRNVAELLHSKAEPSVRISAARALAFAPPSERAEVVRVLASSAAEPDSVGTAILEILQALRR